MITTRLEMKQYLYEDLKATGINGMRYCDKICDRRYRFYTSLRRTEYYTNCYRHLGRIVAKIFRFRHRRLCDKYGWTIPINVCGKGLALVHTGTIVISNKAIIGDYCRIHVDVNIGSAWVNDMAGAPQIGDRVYIGPGAKLFGPIIIGDNTVIGANAVVNKSFPEGNCTIGGIPAKLLSEKNSERYILVRAGTL